MNYQKSISPLIGKYAVVTLARVEIVTPITHGGQAAYAMFNAIKAARPDEPVALVFDGWTRCEYGRPMDSHEINESLMASGLL